MPGPSYSPADDDILDDRGYEPEPEEPFEPEFEPEPDEPEFDTDPAGIHTDAF